MTSEGRVAREQDMDVKRVDPRYARERVDDGQALLVCAYDDEEKCDAMKLEGAIDMRELRSRLAGLPRDEELIFYCG